MSVLENYCYNILKVLGRHVWISLFLVILSVCALLLCGETFSMHYSTEETAEEYKSAYEEQKIFPTSESLSDSMYYRYIEEENTILFEQLRDFKEMLLSCEQFSYFIQVEQDLELFGAEIPDIFLSNYENGNAVYSKYDMDGKTIYSTKAIEISDYFFEQYSIEISEGEKFSQEDYDYKKGECIPVLLGNSYKDYYSIGDEFQGYYLFEECNFVVKGFLAPDSFYYSRSNNDFISCERYILVPALKVSEATYFSRTLLLQQMNGMVSTKMGYQKTSEVYQGYLEESGLSSWDIYIVDPNANGNSAIDVYSSMTKEVSDQFAIMTLIITIFTCLVISSVICRMLKEQQVIFGIMLLCGASYRYIFFNVIGIVSAVVLTGDFITVLLLAVMWKMQVIGLVQIVAASIIVICSLCTLSLRRMNISELIGGRE